MLMMSKIQACIILPNFSLTLHQLSSEHSKMATVIVESLAGLKQSSTSYKRMQRQTQSLTLAFVFGVCGCCPRKQKLNTAPAL